LVENVGRSTARNCHAKILRISPDENEKKTKKKRWKNISLRWANRPVPGTRDTWESCVHLARGESDYVDVAAKIEKDDKIYVPYLHDHQARVKLTQETYDFAICVYSDNTRPSDKIYLRITKNGDNITAEEIKKSEFNNLHPTKL
jgi:hypothetical protein